MCNFTPMTLEREIFIAKVSSVVKDVRIESSISQETMAYILGMSKKTYVQVELKRRKLSWSETVTFCCLFRQSPIVIDKIGDNSLSHIATIASEEIEALSKTHSKSYWWNEIIRDSESYILQNVITGQYKVFNNQDEEIFSTFSIDYIKEYVKKNMSQCIFTPKL